MDTDTRFTPGELVQLVEDYRSPDGTASIEAGAVVEVVRDLGNAYMVGNEDWREVFGLDRYFRRIPDDERGMGDGLISSAP